MVNSVDRASEAELAITKPARPVALSGIKDLNPDVVAVVGLGQRKGKTLARADLVLQPLLVDLVDVEGRVGGHEVEAPDQIVRVVVIAVEVAAVANVVLEPVHGQIHATEPAGVVDLLDAVQGNAAIIVRAAGLLVFAHESGALHEHAARATRGSRPSSARSRSAYRTRRGPAVLRGREAAVGPQLIGRLPQPLLERGSGGVFLCGCDPVHATSMLHEPAIPGC